MNEIKICVEGIVLSGKSTVMRIIFDALTEKGFENIKIDDRDYNNDLNNFIKSTNEKERMITSLKNKETSFTIKQTSMIRNSYTK